MTPGAALTCLLDIFKSCWVSRPSVHGGRCVADHLLEDRPRAGLQVLRGRRPDLDPVVVDTGGRHHDELHLISTIGLRPLDAITSLVVIIGILIVDVLRLLLVIDVLRLILPVTALSLIPHVIININWTLHVKGLLNVLVLHLEEILLLLLHLLDRLYRRINL